MSPLRVVALHDALAAAFNSKQWDSVRALYHDEALLRTVAAHHQVLGPDELMEVFSKLDKTFGQSMGSISTLFMSRATPVLTRRAHHFPTSISVMDRCSRPKLRAVAFDVK